MKRSIAILITLSPLLCRAAGPVPLVYLPFDRDAVVGIGRVDDTAVLREASHPHSGGIRGECLHIDQDLRLPSAGNISATNGTVAFWMRATWQDPGTGHTLFCLYGGEPPLRSSTIAPPPWMPSPMEISGPHVFPPSSLRRTRTCLLPHVASTAPSRHTTRLGNRSPLKIGCISNYRPHMAAFPRLRRVIEGRWLTRWWKCSAT